jgi:hypothetical protein
MFGLAQLIKAQLITEIPNTFWIKSNIDNDLNEISCVFNLVNTSNRTSLDNALLIQTIVADIYLNVPENQPTEFETLSIYVRRQILNLTNVSTNVKYVKFDSEEFLKNEEVNNMLQQKISFEIQYVK